MSKERDGLSLYFSLERGRRKRDFGTMRARARQTQDDSPERRVEHDDQVEVDEEGKVLPEQRLLHGATVPAHLALTHRGIDGLDGRLLQGQRGGGRRGRRRGVAVIAPGRDPHRSAIHPAAHVPQEPLRGPYHEPATGQESLPYPECPLHTPQTAGTSVVVVVVVVDDGVGGRPACTTRSLSPRHLAARLSSRAPRTRYSSCMASASCSIRALERRSWSTVVRHQRGILIARVTVSRTTCAPSSVLPQLTCCRCRCRRRGEERREKNGA